MLQKIARHRRCNWNRWPPLLCACLSVVVVASRVSAAQGIPPVLSIGSAAPDFALTGVDDKVHRLGDYKDSKILVVAFLCNHCTSSQLYESRLVKLTHDYREKGVSVVAIESTNPETVDDKELSYSDVGDSLADMKLRAAYRHFEFPYLYDGETLKVARDYGATVAPEVFIFDKTRHLRYEGRIDDSTTGSLVKTADARNAIDALLQGKPVVTAKTTAVGCAINWTAASPAKSSHSDAAEPVHLTLVGADGLAKLRGNGTGKLLLVNFYATWCGPCVSEFPDLMATNRMYRDRGFVLTTVSSNEPEEEPDVLKFLQKMHAESENLLFATSDTYALQAAFDPAMGPAVPFTVLMAPNGDVLFQQQGDLDMLELRRAILANLPDDAAHAGSQNYWSTK